MATFLMSGCVETHKKTTKRPPSKPKTQTTTTGTPQKVTTESGIPKEIIRPEPKEFASIQTPQRAASQQLINKGKDYLAAGNFDMAARTFQDAVSVDSSNGIAYYYLAKTRYHLKQYDQALGVLDKAESLLTNSAEWIETVSALRNEIQETAAKGTAI